MDYDVILREHGVRATAIRVLILKNMFQLERAFSLEEIYLHLATIDRSTVFRTLSLFEEHALLPGFEDGSGKRKYCLSCSGGGHSHHNHNHIHATCRVCGRTYCVHTHDVLSLPAPDGFEVESVNYIITGVCSACNGK